MNVYYDKDIIDWLERNHTLHREVQITYVVDGYEVYIADDRSNSRPKPQHGKDLRSAITNAMKVWP